MFSRNFSTFFTKNVDSFDNLLSVWSAHKCFVRGILIKQHLTKQKQANTLSDPLARLHVLEHKHKSGTKSTIEADLLKVWESIHEHLLYEAKHVLLKARRSFYEYGDKCSRLLANALRTKRSWTFVSSLFSSSGSKIHATPDLAKAFRDFYSELYNVSPTSSPSPSATLSDVKQYIQEAYLPKITDEDLESFSQSISVEEFAAAIAATQQGKFPGPDGFSVAYYKTNKNIGPGGSTGISSISLMNTCNTVPLG